MSLAAASHAWKLFFPSWNFFDDFSATPRMEFRCFRSGDDPGGWGALYPETSTRRLRRVLFNPWGNVELFEQAFIEQAADELKALPGEVWGNFQHTVTGSRLSEIVVGRVRRLALLPSDTAGWRMQFRLRATTRAEDAERWFESAECTLH